MIAKNRFDSSLYKYFEFCYLYYYYCKALWTIKINTINHMQRFQTLVNVCPAVLILPFVRSAGWMRTLFLLKVHPGALWCTTVNQSALYSIKFFMIGYPIMP